MTQPEAPQAFPGQRVVGEARRLRHELAWTIELPDGRRAVIAQLAPELAAEPALRRRWVTDMERVAQWSAPRLAPTLAIGPSPDPRAPDATPPWRARLDPLGRPLEELLARAPLPMDEAIDLGARLADAIQTFHAAGAVLRDLDPRAILLGDDGAIWFTDVGQARLTILSSRTASSLLLESSPYAAPEALLETVVDPRADVYSLGVVLWRALTGRVPFDTSLLAARTKLPDLATLRAEVPPALVRLLGSCLEADAERRPPTARDVAAALRGGGSAELALTVARTTCQACGAGLRAGLRLCLACGKQAVQFHRARSDDPRATTIELLRANDDAAFVESLRDFFATVATSVPKLNFIVGDSRMYAKSELAQRHALPAVLVAGVAPETGEALARQLRAKGLKIRTRTAGEFQRRRRQFKLALFGGAGVMGAGVLAMMAGMGGAGLAGLLFVPTIACVIGWLGTSRANAAARRLPLGVLRATPAALPAGDALVAKVASALVAAKAPDVRARLEELALLVQRLADAKAARAARDEVSAAEAERVTSPVAPLVELVSATAAAIGALDAQLATLDEGALIRALARSDARPEEARLRQDLLVGLDTLRQLEDERARLFARLLELTSLMRAAAELGLRGGAGLDSEDVEVAHALAALEG